MSRFLISVLAALMCALTSPASMYGADTYTVSGIVVDSIGEGEPFATLRLFLPTDTVTPKVMGVTAEDGAFSLTLPASGRYDLVVSSVGRDNLTRSFEVTPGKPHCRLGTLAMSTASNLLGEIEVVAQRPLVSREIDRIGYDVQADGEAQTSQLDEILRKVPMVTVDADGSIQVKGSSNFKIYKNGRPNNSFTKNAKEIFKAIPASMIKKIEVITDPGAREDAEGVGAILNIVTMENTIVKGVMGNVGLNMSTLNWTPMPNLWLTSQIDKVAFSVSGGLSTMTKRQTSSKTKSHIVYDDSGNVLTTETSGNNPGHIFWLNGELSYELDSLNLFTAEFGGYRYSLDVANNSTSRMVSAAGLPIYSYDSRTRMDPYGYLDFNGNFNYQHLTRRKGEIFTLSYALSTTNQKRNDETIYENYENLPVPYTSQYSDFDLNFVEHTVQADWTRPFAGKHVIDLGGKFIYRDNHSITTNTYDPGDEQHFDFIHRTTIGALYADYRVNLGRLSARAGLRYEYSHLAAKYRDGSQAPFGSDLNDLVPSASVAYNATDASSFKLSYNTTINRPGISYLNPARSESPTNVSYGNPDLGSARNQNISFDYGYIHPKININFSLGYSFTNDAIIATQWTEGNVTYSTYANQGRNRTVSPQLYFNWSIGKNTSLMYNGEMDYNHYANNSLHVKAHGWHRFQYMRLNQRLPWKLTASLSAYESSDFISLYSRIENDSFWDGVGYTLSLRRTFLKDDRLSVSVMASNLGMRQQRRHTYNYNAGVTGETLTIQGARQYASLSLSYRFGSLNTSVKKTAKSISNDDLVGRKQ